MSNDCYFSMLFVLQPASLFVLHAGGRINDMNNEVTCYLSDGGASKSELSLSGRALSCDREL